MWKGQVMLRMQIRLTEAERRALNAASARTGRSIAALIRDAVDSVYGSEHSAKDDLAAMRASFGTWRVGAPHGAPWVGPLRLGSRLQSC